MAICPRCHAPLASSEALCSTCEATFAETALGTVPANLAIRPDARAFVPGTMLLERYRIISPLGRGGMGEVYRADDLTLGQQVALKFLPLSRRRMKQEQQEEDSDAVRIRGCDDGVGLPRISGRGAPLEPGFPSLNKVTFRCQSHGTMVQTA